MKNLFIVCVALMSSVLFSQTSTMPTDSNNILLGRYIDCYAMVVYKGDVADLAASSILQVINTKSSTGTNQLAPKNENMTEIMMTSESMLTQDDISNPNAASKKFDKFVVFDPQDKTGYSLTTNPRTNFSFYVFTPKGAYTYSFDKGKLITSKDGGTESASFVIKPSAYNYNIPVVFFRSSQNPEDNLVIYGAQFSKLNSTKLSLLKGEEDLKHELYPQVLLIRIQNKLDELNNDANFYNLTIKNYNNIVEACKPLMEKLPDIKLKMGELGKKTKTVTTK